MSISTIVGRFCQILKESGDLSILEDVSNTWNNTYLTRNSDSLKRVDTFLWQMLCHVRRKPFSTTTKKVTWIMHFYRFATWKSPNDSEKKTHLHKNHISGGKYILLYRPDDYDLEICTINIKKIKKKIANTLQHDISVHTSLTRWSSLGRYITTR